MQYFEDIAVGTVSRFGSYQVTREEVMEFAGRYDPQPFHLSDEAAAQTHFGRLSASGWHTCAMVMSMIVANLKVNRQAGLGSPGVDELRWLKPVYPGDTLRCETEVIEKRCGEGPEKAKYSMPNTTSEPIAKVITGTNGMSRSVPRPFGRRDGARRY